ncbi:MAG: TIGR03936 family radical SAM-associated protein [Halanaerobium sp.]|nr:TIGR03936 family radical SAM-associated protein [Halanaerobium sp.]
MELRLQFSKSGDLKYISHLDLMRLLTRSFRRARLPIAFSDGYNPKPKISMGPALPVGVSGLKEYFDLELRQELEPDKVLARLNQVLPVGILISRAVEITRDVASLVARINRASYQLSYPAEGITAEGLDDAFRKLFSQKEWKIERIRHKKKNRILDLKPLILEIDWNFTDERLLIDVLVITGSQGNVRVGEVIRLLAREAGLSEIPLSKTLRRALYVEEEAEGVQSLVDPINLAQ